MKYKRQFFPLIAALLMTACGGGTPEKDVTKLFNQTWNANESLAFQDDGSITYGAIMWGGLVAYLYEDGKPVDWSGYKKIVFEFSEPTKVGTQVMVNNKIKAWGSPGITSLQCTLEGDGSTFIEQLAMQTAGETILHIKRIYLSEEGLPNTQTAVWEGKCIFGNWVNGLFISPETFDAADVGDKLELVYTTDTSDSNVNYWQFKAIFGTTDTTLEGCAKDVNEWGCVTVDKGSAKYAMNLTANDVIQLRKNGLYICGFFLVMNQINLLHADEENDIVN